MDRPTRFIIVPAVLLLCGLAGCVVETPVRHDVVVERQAPPQTVYAAPPPVYAAPPPAVIVRP